MSLQVEYIDFPDGAQEDAEFSVVDPYQPVVSLPPFNVQSLSTGVENVPYATLEPSCWKLDGSCRIVGNDGVGWWSSKPTDKYGLFVPDASSYEYAPKIVISLPKLYSASGLTFTFWPAMNQYCSQIKIVWLKEGNTVDELETYPGAPEWIVSHNVENFDKIEIYLMSTNTPFTHAKIQRIQIGCVTVFAKDEVTTVNLLNEIDPSLCALSADEMTVELRYKKKQGITFRQDGRLRLVRDNKAVATHYITDFSKKSKDTVTVHCQSAIGCLEDDFLGGIYNEQPIETLLTDVLGDFVFYIDPEFEGVTVSGYLPVCSRRDALQQIALAVGAVITTQGDGKIRLVDQYTLGFSYFEKEDIFSGASLKKETAINSVQVVAHTYAKKSYNDEAEVLLEEAQVYGTDGFFVFEEPHHSYSVNRGQILESGENWVRLQAYSSQYPTITLKGKKYRHTTSVHTMKTNTETGANRGNVLSVDSATLINEQNVNNVLYLLKEYAEMQSVLTQDVVVRGQEAGQMVFCESPVGTNVNGFIVSMDSDFTASGHTASVKIRGKEM